jgi:hypothetical protein
MAIAPACDPVVLVNRSDVIIAAIEDVVDAVRDPGSWTTRFLDNPVPHAPIVGAAATPRVVARRARATTRVPSVSTAAAYLAV